MRPPHLFTTTQLFRACICQQAPMRCPIPNAEILEARSFGEFSTISCFPLSVGFVSRNRSRRLNLLCRKVNVMVHCPNCGLENPDNAKFCSNCGTPFVGAGSATGATSAAQAQYVPPPPTYQASAGPYQPAPVTTAGNSVAKNIGIGCLIFLAIFLLFGLSCTRACFGVRHRSYIQHRY